MMRLAVIHPARIMCRGSGASRLSFTWRSPGAVNLARLAAHAAMGQRLKLHRCVAVVKR
jgi:hypothetical protein